MSWFSGLEHFVREQEPLARHTWFRLGGNAEYFAEPTSREELVTLVKRCHTEGVPLRILGGGSNLLVRDAGVPGVVVSLSAPEFGKISTDGTKIVAGGGAKLGHVISTAVREGLAGLEELVGIPGSVGGALHGNAGNHGIDIGQFVNRATVLTQTGEVIDRSRAQMVFAFRESSLDELVILEAEFELEPQDATELTQRMQKLWIVKRAHHPMGESSAGCIFKNPSGMRAADLIDQAGLKGTKLGQARISEMHPNFIIADQGATAEDVLRLIKLIADRVEEQTGVRLEQELEVW